MTTYTIQGADLGIREEGPLENARQAHRLFQSFDWQKELELQSQLEAEDKFGCPPGLLINPGDFEYLHFCPNLEGTMAVYCTADVPYKFLGLFNTTKSTLLESEGVNKNRVLPIITNFLEGNNEWLIAHLI
ncbi:MAG: hypothetical protein ABJN69_04180 [Hellea sp.]